jgi:hypothetical protein
MPANEMPHAAMAGKTSSARLRPAMTTIRYPGMKTDTIAHRRPTIELNACNGSPVTLASGTTGMPIDPNATGAVLASRQIPAA